AAAFFGSHTRPENITSLIGPRPRGNIRLIYAVLVRVVQALNLDVAELFLGVSADPLKSRHAIDHVSGQAVAVDLVFNGQLHRRVDVALLLVSADVHALVVFAAIGQPVNQPGIAMEVEDDRLINGKQGI